MATLGGTLSSPPLGALAHPTFGLDTGEDLDVMDGLFFNELSDLPVEPSHRGGTTQYVAAPPPQAPGDTPITDEELIGASRGVPRPDSAPRRGDRRGARLARAAFAPRRSGKERKARSARAARRPLAPPAIPPSVTTPSPCVVASLPLPGAEPAAPGPAVGGQDRGGEGRPDSTVCLGQSGP